MNYFTKYVQWPSDGKSEDFVIAVVGDSPLASELQPFAVPPGTSVTTSEFNCFALLLIVAMLDDRSSETKMICPVLTAPAEENDLITIGVSDTV